MIPAWVPTFSDENRSKSNPVCFNTVKQTSDVSDLHQRLSLRFGFFSATKSHENPSQTHKYLPKLCLPIFSGKLCWKRLCVRGRKHGQTMVSIVDSPNKTFASHMAGPRHDLGGATGRSSRWPRSLAIPGFKASCIANKREDWHGQLTLIQHLPIVINW